MMTQRHPAGLLELKRDFILADGDHDRGINFGEFMRMMRDLDADMTPAELRLGFKALDVNRDGLIDCNEFIDWWTSD